MDRVIEKSFWQRHRIQSAWGIVILIAASVFWFFLPGSGRVLKVMDSRVAISEVVRGQFDDYIPTRGQVAPLKTVFLDAIEGGRVEDIYVEDGAEVKAGDLIVELSNSQLQLGVIAREAEVAEQINNLRNTELSLERNRLEHKRNLVDIDYNVTRLKHQIDRLGPLIEKNLVDAGTVERLQDEYNREVRACDIFVSLFMTKTGKYTKEEFNVAHQAFSDNGKPLIYTFFKDTKISTGDANKADLMSLWSFKEKLGKLGHFYTQYDSTEHLKLQFKDQLEKLRDDGRL